MKFGSLVSIIYLLALQIYSTNGEPIEMSFIGIRSFQYRLEYNLTGHYPSVYCCIKTCKLYHYDLRIYHRFNDVDKNPTDGAASYIINSDGRQKFYLKKVIDIYPDELKNYKSLHLYFSVYCASHTQKQDTWVEGPLTYYPYTGSSWFERFGTINRMTFTFAIKGNCPGRAGQNCYISCVEDEMKYCDEKTGLFYCKNNRFGKNCEYATSSCNSNPCKKGICEEVGAGFVCHCNEGYTGETCNTVACTESQCKNGVCQAGQKCNCFVGYSGKYCQTFELSPSYCNGRGTAVRTEDVTSYSCTCYEDSTGPNCEYTCTGGCRNGGKCVTRRNAGFCECVSLFSGKNCETKKGAGACSGVDCQNGGLCKKIGNQDFICQCGEYWYGSFCEISVCLTDYCYHGTCMDNRGCVCFDGYSGKRCENINDQTYSECKNGGTKTVKLGFLSCNCNEKTTTGTFCEYQCRKKCVFGTCQWSDSIVQCVCDSGYTGDDCTTIETHNICDTQPCLNGGECSKLFGNEFQCKCNKYWTGQLCEQSTCKSNQCFKGICIDGVGCTCFKGYNGTMCSVPKCPDDNALCTRPEECKILGSKIYCDCDKTQHFGSRCEYTCNPACSGNGICRILDGELKCICYANYRGSQCKELIVDPAYLYTIYGCSAAIVILICLSAVIIVYTMKHKLRFATQAVRNAMFDASAMLGIKRGVNVKSVDDTYGSNGQKSWAINSK